MAQSFPSQSLKSDQYYIFHFFFNLNIATQKPTYVFFLLHEFSLWGCSFPRGDQIKGWNLAKKLWNRVVTVRKSVQNNIHGSFGFSNLKFNKSDLIRFITFCLSTIPPQSMPEHSIKFIWKLFVYNYFYLNTLNYW